MAKRPWTEKERQELISLRLAGLSAREVAARMGRSVASVNCKWNVDRGESDVVIEPPLPPEPVCDAKAELKAFAAAAGVPDRPKVTCEWYDEESVADLWERAEKTNARHIDKARHRHQFKVDFATNEPIGVVFASDQHIAPGTPVDMARMRADAEYVRDTPNLYALLLGDGVDNHIKHRGAIMAARSQPSDQYQLYEYYLTIFAGKVLAMCSGNHDAWSDQIGGIDMVQWIAAHNKLCYSPAEFRMQVTVGGQLYKIAARHQYRMNSSFNQTHCVKQWQRLGEEDFDIGGIGHHHEPSTESFSYRGKQCWACRPGSYQITSAHSRQYGYNSTYPTCPTFILYPGERRIVGFDDMRVAGTFLQHELGRKVRTA